MEREDLVRAVEESDHHLHSREEQDGRLLCPPCVDIGALITSELLFRTELS